ncbi:MAG: methyltransferase domain-containing protein [Deltaproteobacteria bacterium]|nr:methyltransferase domain-containing protein [Deltaproteobacteria bacterium]MBW2256587.1 methyltransferase domain-containing protein [Deltaproteobacteria bacterium]
MAEWYQSFFEGDWLYVQRNIFPPEKSEADAEAIIGLLGLQPGQEVLDVPCGTGRIAIPLAARGLVVTGVDFTAALLEDAHRDGAGFPVTWEERDMRDLPWTDRFHAAVNMWGSFGYFDDAGDLAFAKAVCRALIPGGRFLIDGPSLETILPIYQPHGWFAAGDAKVIEDRAFDPMSGRNEVDFTIIRQGRETTRHISMRCYSCAELVRLLRRAGFSECAVYGSLEGDPFEIGKRMALVATK